MNSYMDALEQAAIERDIRRQEFTEQINELSRHKGQWCFFEDRTFCQEDSGCPNCEIFLRSKGDK